MSWSGNCLIPKGATNIDIRERLVQMTIVGNEDCAAERDREVAFARQFVLMMLINRALGSADYAYRVSVRGHANPEHKPRSGWTPDHINVSIDQVAEEREG